MKIGNSWNTRSYAYDICQENSILTLFKTCFVASIDQCLVGRIGQSVHLWLKSFGKSENIVSAVVVNHKLVQCVYVIVTIMCSVYASNKAS